MKVGTKIWVPEHQAVVTITRMRDDIPYEGQYIDDTGRLQIVDLITTTWEVITLIKRLLIIIRSLFN